MTSHRRLALLLALTACAPAREPTSDGDRDPSGDGWQQQVLVGPPRPQLDILFVVGDGPAMGPWQTRLVEAFADVAPELDRLDLRIAVTSTAFGERTGGAFHPAAEATAPACRALADEPPVLTSPVPPDPDRLTAHFACLAAVGAHRGTPDRGLDAVDAALSCDGPNVAWLDPCGGPPGRFLRADAALLIAVVSDTDDCSGAAITCAANGSPAPVAPYARRLVAHEPDPRDAFVWTFVPPDTAPRYVAFAEHTLDPCVPEGDGYSSAGCALTAEDLTLDRLTHGCAHCIPAWCLDGTPACVAEDRECPAEELEVALDCSTATARCDPQTLDAWVEPHPTCEGGAKLRLTSPLPADARLTVRYR